MKTMTFTAQIAPDGTLQLEFPTGLPPGPAEVVVVVNPTATGPAPSVPSPSGENGESARQDLDVGAEMIEKRRRALRGFIDRARSPQQAAQSRPDTPPQAQIPESEPEPPNRFCSGLFIGRLPEDYDIDAAIDEMNAQWKAKLEDLKLEP